ncbi:CU044_5270 family protein [Micromonospora sp. LOL_015]|uniref:CU044_5270 family protein n=1 Tax=Micromonospora sp. LOL_015 TaxID=3345416 RepID=UPI003A883F2D
MSCPVPAAPGHGREGPDRSSERLCRRSRRLDEPGARTMMRRGGAALRSARRWSLGLAGGALAALLVVVTVGALVRGGWPAGGSAPPPGTAEAADILRTAAFVAHEADLPVPRAGQFVFTETVASPINQVQQPDGGFSTAQGPRVLRQTWLSADGTRDGLVRDRPYRQDRAASDELVLPACPAVLSADAVSGRPCTPQRGFDAGMPDSPAAVLDWLRAGVSSAAGPKAASVAAPGGGVADALVLQRAGELLVGGRYLTSGQRSALFAALASLPGVTVRQQVRDLANRPGVGVGLADGTTLVFDATSYAFLGTTNSALLRQATVDGLGDIPS